MLNDEYYVIHILGSLQVKVYQLPAWLLRRQFYNPIAYGRAISR